MNVMPPQEWLRFLNHALIVQNGEIREKTKHEQNGQQMLPTTGTQHLTLQIRADMILEGSCSDPRMLELMNNSKSAEDFPMGTCIGRAGEPPKSWLHSIIASHKPKSIIVYAECCGSYLTSYEGMLRQISEDHLVLPFDV